MLNNVLLNQPIKRPSACSKNPNAYSQLRPCSMRPRPGGKARCSPASRAASNIRTGPMSPALSERSQRTSNGRRKQKRQQESRTMSERLRLLLLFTLFPHLLPLANFPLEDGTTRGARRTCDQHMTSRPQSQSARRKRQRKVRSPDACTLSGPREHANESPCPTSRPTPDSANREDNIRRIPSSLSEYEYDETEEPTVMQQIFFLCLSLLFFFFLCLLTKAWENQN